MTARLIDVAVAGLGLVIAFPLLAVLGLAVRLTSRGPALFRQLRVGRGGRPFVLLKLRTMRVASEGPEVTALDDARVTPLGRVLRRWKLDELPQLANVLRGDMSLIGPRPEVPRYLARMGALADEYLAVRPGLADPATLAFYDEAAELAAADDPERQYLERILPEKMRLSVAYQRERTGWSDLRVAWALVRRLATSTAVPWGIRHV
jgi:lipopolysaccharide/colanic/teichoic acid biosynthesis glycosyltransferase